jgi:hypothetical protein
LEPSSARTDTAQQLEDLRARISEGNPEHYRHWALYLQVLRESLPAVVDRCCFQLAVEVYPNRYRQLPLAARRELHQRMANLVQRCCSLLTVEQLLALAAQQRRRHQRLARRQQRRWLASLQQDQEALFDPEASAAPPSPDAPPGSVHLGMALPISLDLFTPSPVAPTAVSEAASPTGVPVDSPDGAHEAAELIEAFSRMLASAAEAEPDPSSGPHPTAQRGLLPSHPLQLLRWMEELDGALARRLLNLSHALNVELVRLGLCPALAPLHLLEAVAAGQLETQNAPLNLLRLNGLSDQLPDSPEAHGLVVFLRQVDLEADQPRLRTCRSRLRQVRQEVRRMAQTYHRLERRLQALEAEQLWLHDHSTARNQSSLDRN